ncbi:MAG: hypothetical protein SFZ23_05850 [Planctomycetota bacterium]|nr:hypothetical protein [Planctomycetota bacterium]
MPSAASIRRRLACFLLALVAPALAQPATQAPSQSPGRAEPASETARATTHTTPPIQALKPLGPIHVSFPADFDTIKLASDLRQIFDSAAGSPLVLLELSGDRGRTDVLLQLIDAVRQSPVRVVAFLSDTKDKRVGMPQLALALACSSVWLSPDLAITSRTSDEPRNLAPLETDWPVLNAQLEAALIPSLTARGLPDHLAQRLWKPSFPLFLLRPEPGSGNPFTFPTSIPDAADLPPTRASSLVVRDNPHPRFVTTLPAAVALEVGLCDASAPRAIDVLRAEAASARPVIRKSIQSGLELARGQIGAAMHAADASLDRVRRSLELPDPPDSTVAPGVYRSTARNARESLARVARELDQITSTTTTYPELLREWPPGVQPPKRPRVRPGQPPPEQPDPEKALARAWHEYIELRRDRIRDMSVIVDRFSRV